MAQKLETVAVTLIQYLSFDFPMEKTLYIPLKNLIFNIHQA